MEVDKSLSSSANTTNNSGALVTDVSKKGNNILVAPAENTTTNQIASEKMYRLPDFISFRDGSVLVQTNIIPNPEEFVGFIESVFESGYYFSDIDYRQVSEIAYDFQNFQNKMRGKSGEESLAKIASGIKSFEEKRIPLYRKPKVNLDKKSADYSFETVYIEEIQEDGTKKEIKAQTDIDEFIAAMWNYGVRFGLDIKLIQDIIRENTISRITIAREKDPTLGEDAVLIPVISFDIKHGVKIVDEESNAEKDGFSKASADLLVYRQPHIEVKKDAPLYKKQPRKDGKLGWTIMGRPIEPKVKPLDFSIDHFLGIGVHKENRQGIDYIVSNSDGFPRREEVQIREQEVRRCDATRVGKKGEILRLVKIHLDLEHTIDGSIDVDTTGKYFSNEPLKLTKDIRLDSAPKSLHTKGSLIQANLDVVEYAIIEGDITGTVSGRMNERHQRSNKITKGRVIAKEGFITVHGNINVAYLEAKKGQASVCNISNSVIVADTIVVTGNAVNCVFIANRIITEGKVIGCKLVSKISIKSKESTKDKRDEENENIFSIFFLDLRSSIENTELGLRKEQADVDILENEMEAFVMKAFPNLVKIIPEKKDRLGRIRILLEMLFDANYEGNEKYQPHIPSFKALKPILMKSNLAMRESIKKHYTIIHTLQDKLLKETAIMEQMSIESFLDIGEIDGPTKVRFIEMNENKNVLDLEQREIDMVTASFPEQHGDIELRQKFVTKNIAIPSSGPFLWRVPIKLGTH